MTLRDPSRPMWVHALQMLEKADRLHRQFFQLRKSSQHGPTWEPPVDIFETKNEFHIWIALPGVSPGDIRIFIEKNTLTIIGDRPLVAGKGTAIRRMEIPHGRFERRIKLESGRLEIQENTFVDGCLKLVLKKNLI